MSIQVTFVCMGNICRSPMAHAVFADMVAKAGLGSAIKVDSCGTGGWHGGENAHPGTLKVLDKHGISYTHSARQLTRADLAANYLIPMDKDNMHGIESLGEPTGKCRLLLSYAPDTGHSEVPDPYYDGRFDEVYALVEAGCRGLLAHIREKESV